MKNRSKQYFQIILMIAIFATMGISGCSWGVDETLDVQVPTVDSPPDITVENYPRVDGSTSTLPLNMLIACTLMEIPCVWMQGFEGYMHLAPDLTASEGDFPTITTSGTHGAYVSLITGESDLILVARRPSGDELHSANVAGVQLIPKPIALDAFVFILSDENPVENLTTRQIQDIYTGKLTNWQAVGGPDLDIHPYQRNPNSGSQELMVKLVMKDLPMIDAPEMVLPMMMAPFYALSSDPLGISYSVYYFEEFMAGIEKVKLCAVDGVMPSYESIHSGDYPYITEVYAVVRDGLDPQSPAYQLWAWLLSPGGQEVVAESGYIPVPELTSGN
jgi:phosphate transport system substrate-binding protein